MASLMCADTLADSTGLSSPDFPFGTFGLMKKYFSGYFNKQWNFAGTGFSDPTISSGSNTLTTIYSSGLTIAAASSNVLGVTITPSVSGAVYLINFEFGISTATSQAVVSVRLTDGTTVIGSTGMQLPITVNSNPAMISTMYVAPSTAAFTLKMQGAISSATLAAIGDPSVTTSIGIQVTVIEIT